LLEFLAVLKGFFANCEVLRETVLDRRRRAASPHRIASRFINEERAMEFDDIKLELRTGRNTSDHPEASFNSFGCTLTQSCTCETCSAGNCTQTIFTTGG
jgi:hypothetical protein